MKRSILRIENLRVMVEEQLILEGVSVEVAEGEVVALMGPNGSGKSSLALSLMGSARYQIAEGSRVELLGENLLSMDESERARKGLFVGWQNPVAIPGVSLFNLCRASYDLVCEAQGRQKEYENLVEFKKMLEGLALRVGLASDIIGRNVNEGFSGGEKKRLELLQLLLLKPKLAILDEIDSGLDVDGLKMVAKIIEQVRQEGSGVVLITHYKKLLDYVDVSRVWVLKKGGISRVGGREIAEEIEELGYDKLSTGI